MSTTGWGQRPWGQTPWGVDQMCGWGLEPWGQTPWGLGSCGPPPFVYGHTPTLISGVCVDEGLRSSDELVFVMGWDLGTDE